jgi:flagellar hook-associated protein 3 FlgL
MQFNGLEQSLTNLDHSLDSLSDKVSSFGAKGNRIDVQAQIYSGLQIAAKENLSDVQDTDLIKAIMDLKAKEVAYQATLASAAKTMQLSLVDYL